MQRFSKPTQSLGVSIIVAHTKFTPTPTMSPQKVAFAKGREAKRTGRPASNPHDGGVLATEWEKGYTDDAPK